jgi:carbonic anhydrase
MECLTNQISTHVSSSKFYPLAKYITGNKENAKSSGGSFETATDQAQSVVADVTRIRTSPLVPKSIPIYGYIYDVKSGKLIEVPAATEAGRAH